METDEEMRENSERDLSKVPKNLQPHVFKKGQIANPLGRKKGSVSLKQYAKQMLESMSYEERMEYLEGLPKQFIWEMAEGKADTKTDITSDGKALPQPLLYNVLTNDKPQENSSANEED